MLNLGDIIEVNKQRCEVIMVNESRAVAAAIERQVREFTDRRRDRLVRFREARRHFSISPNSEVPVLTRNAERGVRNKGIAVVAIALGMLAAFGAPTNQLYTVTVLGFDGKTELTRFTNVVSVTRCKEGPDRLPVSELVGPAEEHNTTNEFHAWLTPLKIDKQKENNAQK
jgi:hypothetical protein